MTLRKGLAATVAWLVFAAPIAAAAATASLVDAARQGDHALVRRLVQEHADVNELWGDGSAALHWAVYWNNEEIVNLLLKAGAKPNLANDLGVTPLHWAARGDRAPIVQRLLQAGANPNSRALSGETPLMAASASGDAAAVRLLLGSGAEPNHAEATHGQTALMWAAARGHSEIVRLLLESRADVHARSTVTSAQFHVGDRQILARAGVVLKVLQLGGFTPLLFAARSGDVESVRHLIAAKANPNDSALALAAFSNNADVALFLLGQGANLDAAGSGYGPLHAAVLRGNLPLVKALLAAGANPNAALTQGTPVKRMGAEWAFDQAWAGATPLWLAAKFAEPDIMRALIAAGANGRVEVKGRNVLQVAAAVGAGGIGIPLDEASLTDVDRRDRPIFGPGLNPLTREEAERQMFETVKAALTLGLDINASDDQGRTALHGATGYGFNSVVQLLADAGADLNVKDKRGLTPLGLSLGTQRSGGTNFTRNLGNHPHTAELLRKLGAVE